MPILGWGRGEHWEEVSRLPYRRHVHAALVGVELSTFSGAYVKCSSESRVKCGTASWIPRPRVERASLRYIDIEEHLISGEKEIKEVDLTQL